MKKRPQEQGSETMKTREEKNGGPRFSILGDLEGQAVSFDTLSDFQADKKRDYNAIIGRSDGHLFEAKYVLVNDSEDSRMYAKPDKIWLCSMGDVRSITPVDTSPEEHIDFYKMIAEEDKKWAEQALGVLQMIAKGT